jgi:hypothetical protein
MLTNFLSAVDFVFDLQMGNSSLDCPEQLVGSEADGRHVVGPEMVIANFELFRFLMLLVPRSNLPL